MARFALPAVFCLALFACGDVPSENVEALCTDLVMDYAYHRDRLDPDGVAELFTTDARMSVLGDEFLGRDAIRKRMLDGQNGPVTRHMMSTVRIFPVDAERATGVSYVTVYLAPRADTSNPLALEGFAGLGEYHDVFEKTETGWKIAQREFVPVFVYEDAD